MSSSSNGGDQRKPASADAPAEKAPRKRMHWSLRILLGLFGTVLGLVVMVLLGVTFIVALTYPKLPDLDTLTDYRPKIPLRIFSADGVLIGEFGEERRNLVHFKDIPDIMKKAVLAIEDDRFYEHGGVDYQGIARATFSNLSGGGGGASTITQQVARNFFLTSNEPTFLQKATRKFFYEIPLAWKIENNLTKDQILEVYMNQIYLGQRAYGFASAAQIYFGKQLKDLTIAEAAMLAGLPKAPSAYNPVVNPKRAHARQQYILSACASWATSPMPSTRKPRMRNCASRATARPSACTPNTWPKWRASWSTRSTRTRPTRAA
jgi:penicillin-binding protein 1A